MRRDRLREIVSGAARLEGIERARHLEAACGTDSALRAEAERLLDAAVDDDTELSRDTIASAARLPPPPFDVGPHRAEREVGRGGTGVVFCGTDTRDGSPVALKVLHPHLIGTTDALERFAREADMGRRVLDENVVRTLDALSLAVAGVKVHVLVLEWIEGRNLRALMRDLGRVPESLVREIGRQVAGGLAAIHAAGIVHRDVKPENVVLTADGRRALLMDLGIARRLEESQALTTEGQFVGTLAYAAPEQFDGSAVGPPTDLHAVGVLLYELATGTNPFRRPTAAATIRACLEHVPPRVTSLAPDVSDLLDDLVATLLVKDPAGRLASASELQRILVEAETGPWWVARRDRARGRVPRVPVGRETPLRGRAREVVRLREAWFGAQAGAGRVALVTGEAGLGKSRLAAELLREAGSSGARLLYGAFPPTRGLGGLTGSLVDAFGSERTGAEIQRLLPDSPALASRLAAVVEGEADALAPMTAVALASAFAALASAMAERAPTLWVLEDLQHASEEAWSIVREIARVAANARLLVVLTARTGTVSSQEAEVLAWPHAERIELARLDRMGVAAMLADQIDDVALAERLAEEVAARASGNPFYALELLRGLRESGVLVAGTTGALHLARPVAEAPVPERLRDLVLARLDELSPVERIVLDVASLQGTEFDAALLARSLELPLVAVLQHLARLERVHGLVRASGRRLRFEHPIAREIVERAIPEALAEQYHGLLADALEAQPPRTAQERWQLLRHRLLSPEPAAGIGALEEVIAERERSHRLEQAVEGCFLALAHAGLLAPDRRVDLLLRLASLLHVLGRRTREVAAAELAVQEARALGDPAREAKAHAAVAAAHVALHEGTIAIGHARSALACAERAGDEELALEMETHLGAALLNHGEHEEASRRLTDVAARASAAGLRAREAGARASLGLRELREGRLDAAQDCFERVLELSRSEGLTALERQSDGNLAVVAMIRGDRPTARERFERVLLGAREEGDRRVETLACGYLGELAVADGRLEEARALFGRERALAEEIGEKAALVSALGETAVLEALAGEVESARELVAQVLEGVRELPHPRIHAFVAMRLARVDLVLGEAEAAAQRLDECMRTVVSEGAIAAEAGADLAVSLLACGRRGEAAAAAREALDTARAAGADGPAHLATCVLVATGATDVEAGPPPARASWLQSLLGAWLVRDEPAAQALFELAASTLPELRAPILHDRLAHLRSKLR